VPVARRPRAKARRVADRLGAIEVLEDHPSDALGCTVDGHVKIVTDVLDHGDRRVNQVNLDAAELVNPATRPVFVTKPHPDPLDAVAVASQQGAQPAPHALGQGLRHRKSLSMNVDNQFAPHVRPSEAMREFRGRRRP
jgi:hypothetical protein